MLPEASCTSCRCNAALTSGELLTVELLLSMLSGSNQAALQGPRLARTCFTCHGSTKVLPKMRRKVRCLPNTAAVSKAFCTRTPYKGEASHFQPFRWPRQYRLPSCLAWMPPS